MPDEVDRAGINFAQAEGAEPLPRQLALQEVSRETRALIWPLIWEPLDRSARNAAVGYKYAGIQNPWHAILIRWHVHELHEFADTFDKTIVGQIAAAKKIVELGSYTDFFKFIEFIARDRDCPPGFSRQVNAALENSRSAYRLVDDCIIPLASDEDASTITTAFKLLQPGRFPGARTHLVEAGRELTKGNWASSVRESIHSVESAARILAPGADALGPALAALEKRGTIHGGLKAGFNSLYGFSSDEKGIRHPLLDQGDANVSEADALYMFGACAAFLTYLTLKAPDER